MKIRVTRRIELNGKVEEKSAEGVANPSFGYLSDDKERENIGKMLSLLFESLNPPMMAVDRDGNVVAQVFTDPPQPTTTPRVDMILSLSKKVAKEYGLNYTGIESLLIAMTRINGLHSEMMWNAGITEPLIVRLLNLKHPNQKDQTPCT